MSTEARTLRFLTWPLILLGFAPGPGDRAEAAAAAVLTGYSVTSWTETEAGPLGAVSDIVQDRDGYLWIGTSVGLFRFDGTRFKHWDALGNTRLPASPVSALTITRDGTLWVGFANRAGVARIRGRTLEPTEAGRMRVVNAIVEDRSGTIWAVAEPSLFRLTEGAWERAPVASATEEARIVSAGVTSHGDLWAGSPTGLFLHTEANSFSQGCAGLGLVRQRGRVRSGLAHGHGQGLPAATRNDRPQPSGRGQRLP